MATVGRPIHETLGACVAKRSEDEGCIGAAVLLFPISERTRANKLPMHYVYMIESVHDRTNYYVGQTSDLKSRLAEHNAGKSLYTRRFKPWRLASYHAFAEQQKAIAFERYLKSGSGRTFLKRHLL